jgi:hypothetical protein
VVIISPALPPEWDDKTLPPEVVGEPAADDDDDT